MKIKFTGIVLGLFVAVLMAAPTARAQTPDLTALLATLQSLIAQVELLQAQLAQVQGEVSDLIQDGLVEGTSGNNVREIQVLLASDPTIYPEGITSGYFGHLTHNALQRFQVRHGIESTGRIDEDTKDLLEEYFTEREDGEFPEGFLRDPGIAKKIEGKVCKSERRGHGHGFGAICTEYVDNEGDSGDGFNEELDDSVDDLEEVEDSEEQDDSRDDYEDESDNNI